MADVIGYGSVAVATVTVLALFAAAWWYGGGGRWS